jgi:hypothetical protein
VTFPDALFFFRSSGFASEGAEAIAPAAAAGTGVSVATGGTGTG